MGWFVKGWGINEEIDTQSITQPHQPIHPPDATGIEVEVLETQQVVRYGLCTHDGSYTLDYYDEEIDVSHLGNTAKKVEYFEAHIIKKASVCVCVGLGSGGSSAARLEKNGRSLINRSTK